MINYLVEEVTFAYFVNFFHMTMFFDPKSKKLVHKSWETKEDIARMWEEARREGLVYECMHFMPADEAGGEAGGAKKPVNDVQREFLKDMFGLDDKAIDELGAG